MLLAVTLVKRLVCLANSRKLSGRCIAGKELTGAWVRPVSDRPKQEVSEEERQYNDGSDPRVLDIMDVPMKYHLPNSYQSENWLLDPEQYWVLVRRAGWNDLNALADHPEGLWVNESSSSVGLNDRVEHGSAERLTSSLYLIRPEKVMLRVFAPGADFGNPKRRVQADLWYGRVNYRLWITDPLVEQTYLARKDGNYQVGECFATVSLGERHDDGYCYKLVAALITPD
jgi:hypothetical protein